MSRFFNASPHTIGHLFFARPSAPATSSGLPGDWRTDWRLVEMDWLSC